MINVIYKNDYNSLRKIFTIQLQDFLKRFWKIGKDFQFMQKEV